MATHFDYWSRIAEVHRQWSTCASTDRERGDYLTLASTADVNALRALQIESDLEAAELVREHAAKIREITAYRPDNRVTMLLRELALKHELWADRLERRATVF